jgi:hypothetical protein
MIDNTHPSIFNLDVGLFPSLMGTFSYPLPLGDVKIILVVPNQPRAAILQVSLFRMSYFNDPWILPSPLTSMEGKGNPSMAIPLFAAEVAYKIFQ